MYPVRRLHLLYTLLSVPFHVYLSSVSILFLLLLPDSIAFPSHLPSPPSSLLFPSSKRLHRPALPPFISSLSPCLSRKLHHLTLPSSPPLPSSPCSSPFVPLPILLCSSLSQSTIPSLPFSSHHSTCTVPCHLYRSLAPSLPMCPAPLLRVAVNVSRRCWLRCRDFLICFCINFQLVLFITGVCLLFMGGVMSGDSNDDQR